MLVPAQKRPPPARSARLYFFWGDGKPPWLGGPKAHTPHDIFIHVVFESLRFLFFPVSHGNGTSPPYLLNFTRSWGFGIFRVYWVSKSKCIISSNLRAEGSSGKVLNVVIFVESVVHRSNWRSRETETVGNSRKQSGAARRDHAKIVNPPFFCKKKVSAQSHFF